MSDVQLTKTKVNTSGRKIAPLGQEYIRAREYAQLARQTRTQHSAFIDMRDAHTQACNKNYKPTQ